MMTPSQDEDYNRTKVIHLPHNGCRLSRKPNPVGGFIYESDELGGGTHVWDSSIVEAETLRMALEDEHLFLNQFPNYPIACKTCKFWPIGAIRMYEYQGRMIDLEICDYADGVHLTRDQWIIVVLDQVRDGLLNMHTRTGFRFNRFTVFKYLGYKITSEFLRDFSVQKLRALNLLLKDELTNASINKSNGAP